MSRVLVIGSEAQVSREIGGALSGADFPMEYSAGHADALQRLRARAFGIVITSPDSTVEEDLALLEEMRAIRPGVKCIVLARHSTPDEVIAALRARVFACFTPPFDPGEIASLASKAASDPACGTFALRRAASERQHLTLIAPTPVVLATRGHGATHSNEIVSAAGMVM